MINLYKKFVLKKGTRFWAINSFFILFPCTLIFSIVVIMELQFKYESKVIFVPKETIYYLPYNSKGSTRGIEFILNKKRYQASCVNLRDGICRRQHAHSYLNGQDIVFLQIAYSRKLVKGLFIKGKMSNFSNQYYNVEQDISSVEKIIQQERNSQYSVILTFLVFVFCNFASFFNVFLCLKFRSK